jgi:dolichyl-phosphate beta-glucosyltransferase
MNDTKSPDENSVSDWLSKQPQQCPPVDISVVVPAYNEERRLPPTLINMIDYMDEHHPSHEIIIVDDGSTDSTAEVVTKFEKIRPTIRLIRLARNQGKGHAVRMGVLNSKGARIVFADADGATPIEELPRLLKALHDGAQVAIGSRAAQSTETTVKTSWYRKYPGRIFNFFVNNVVLPGIKDTQCGFKIFTAPAAQFIFSRQKADRFSFDVELLFLATRAGMKISEVPVNWTNVPGSKVNVLVDGLKMLRDVFIFRFRHRGVTPEDFTGGADSQVSK